MATTTTLNAIRKLHYTANPDRMEPHAIITWTIDTYRNAKPLNREIADIQYWATVQKIDGMLMALLSIGIFDWPEYLAIHSHYHAILDNIRGI